MHRYKIKIFPPAGKFTARPFKELGFSRGRPFPRVREPDGDCPDHHARSMKGKTDSCPSLGPSSPPRPMFGLVSISTGRPHTTLSPSRHEPAPRRNAANTGEGWGKDSWRPTARARRGDNQPGFQARCASARFGSHRGITCCNARRPGNQDRTRPPSPGEAVNIPARKFSVPYIARLRPCRARE